ncbi:hypothetical protein BRC96_08805 [Halobacteriales archaeon QS_6_64_34]|nr:MAG: hypothetical protein BRC96_08805 [Halobacteriales archaeon QS_6_64_34]
MATEQSDSSGVGVPPLENTAFFVIESDEEYVRIEQSLGNQVKYAPAEARDIAHAILDAAERTE